MKKKTGLLITNAFLNTAKFDEIYDLLADAAEKNKIELIRRTNADFLATYSTSGVTVTSSALSCDNTEFEYPDFILFWDKDIRLAHAFEALGVPVFNSASAIELCDDKALTLEKLAGLRYCPETGGPEIPLRLPVTIMAPMTFHTVGFTNLSFLETVEKTLSYPLIIKECFGSFGAQVYLARNRDEALHILEGIQYPFLFQEYIPVPNIEQDPEDIAARDIRLQVVGDQVVAAMLRTNDHDFRANITNGGSMAAYTPSQAEAALAVNVCRALELDFAGVDILFSTEGPILCEVNSNAHFKNISDCTGVDVASHILRHIAGKI